MWVELHGKLKAVTDKYCTNYFSLYCNNKPVKLPWIERDTSALKRIMRTNKDKAWTVFDTELSNSNLSLALNLGHANSKEFIFENGEI